MSDSEESNGSDQQYTVVDEIAPETDSRRRTRRRDSKPKKAAAATSSQPEFESEEDNSNSNVASRYEEDEDYHEPLKKKRGSRGSEKRKSRKSKSKSHDSEEEVPVDDEDSERAVPPLKIKLPPREKSKRSSKRKNEIDDGVLSNEEDELDGNVASSSSRSKSKSNSNGNSSNNSKQQQQEDSTHVPTRRSERIFVSNTKKVPDLNDEFEELPIEEEPFKIIHKDYCQSCRQGGELILCDYCPRAFHKVCLDDELPEELPEDWCCPNCEKNGKPDPKELRQQQEALVAKKKKKQKEVAVSSSKPKGKKEIENRDYCEICNQCGELLLCDTCPRAYHLVCMDADMKAIPSGTWSCPHCIEHGIEVSNDDVVIPEEKAEKVEKIICKGCRQSGGEIIFCATCPTRFHIQCMNPPLDEAPEEWHCMACSVEPLKAKVQRILTWRWKKTPQEAESDKSLSAEDSTKNLLKNLKNRRPREREFFVKWKDMSYWHTSWVDDSQLQVFHSNLYRFYIQKNDMSNPPIFDEVGTISTESIESKSDDSNSTDINDTDQGIKASVAAKHRRQKRCCNLSPELEKTYVRYGIRPEWLLIQRIINHRKSRGKLYYVIKWRDLPYEEVTVEPEPENCDFEIPDYQKKIDEYWNLKRLIDEENADPEEKSSKKRDKDDKRKKDKRKKAFGSVPKSDPKKKWDDQPDYIPEPLKLHEYQVEGCTWLRFSWASGIDTILADEMGLGKTIQTITFLYSLYKEGHSRGPFLIAAPLSTIINWERELEDWAPDFYVVNYTGNKDSRIIIRENELSFDSDATRSSAKASRIRKNIPVKFHVMLTSYELINMDSALLSSIDWKVLVVDEAHRLKSNQSLFFRTLNNYSVAHKLLLTGTPLQNNLEELFNLLNFLSPSRFCDMEGFLSEFADIAKEEQVKKLHELLGSHLLRRLKADVLSGMPSKSEFIIRVDLAPLQKKYYKYILTRNYAALNSKGIGKQVSLLNVVMDLKKCCNHPYLFPVAAEEAPKTKFGYFEGAPLVKACGKLLVLHKMLQKLKADGHRVLIFSQMTHMLDILEDFCEAEGYKYERIDGSITGSLRQESIDRFNAPGAQQFVFLLSTRAGGLGINLATADTVIIYDSDWNPHNDIQALSRAHRIGQTNKVMIYRFVTRNSVEERITQVAKKKMMLTHLVVRPGLGSAKSNTAMSKQELDDILKFGTEELFKEEEGKETETIHYDDKAIEDLLDRSNEGIEQKEMWSNEYLSSFKVASYATKEVEEEEVEVAPPKPEKDESQNDPHYWEKLLGVHYVQYQENVSRTLGKGKRVRKQVNYMDSTTGQNEFQTQDSSGESSEFSVPSDQSENDEDFDEKIESRNQKSLRTKNPIREKMPPLLSQMGPNTEVIGFTPKHRKTFLDLVMRFGLPSLEHNITDSQFYVRELKSKSEKHLRAYASLFISHLCEPGDPSSLTFDDGVPKEGLNVSQVLTRIGIISLIKRKVFEYQHKHGDVSMKLVKKPQISLIAQPNSSANGNELIDPVKNETNEANDKVAPPTTSDDKKEKVEDCKEEKESDEVKEKVVDDDDKEKAAADDKDKIDDEIKEKVDELKDKVDEEMKDKADEDEKEEIKKEESMEVDEPAKDKKESEELKKEDTETDSKNDDSKVKEEDSTAENSTAKVDKVDESNQDKPVKTETNGVIEVKSDDEEEVSETEVKQFEFSIQDGGLTELHTLWYFEDKELKPKHEHEIWNRRHDFWMLAGIVKHGYERWSDVSRDEVFCILNEPFKSSSHLRDKFMERRLRLLEQALVFEEQLRRFSHLETAEKLVAKPAKESEKMAVDSEENKEDVENEKEGKVSEDKEEEETVQNGDKEVEEDKNEEETEAKQNGDKNKEDKVDKKKNGDTKKVDDNEDVEEKKESNKQNGDEKNGHIEGEDKENEENNLILNPSIQRAANQLEDLLIDMKSDCARIPQTVQRIPSIANRLQIGPPRTGASILPSASSRLM